ncbi:MAG: uncharacterized protein PWQ57_1875 [Desulfovibrionales bacterium]|jgi:uncharacterized protein YdcH (DUF465 family)|nr:uncharacterized protein [Desulfovibrionales bacterium]
MDQRDIQLIEQFGKEDAELMALYHQHVEYERMLNKYDSKPYLSPTQEQEVRELKKKKLAGKTKLQLLLDKYRQVEA